MGSSGDLADEIEDSRTSFALHSSVWPLPPPGQVTVACAWPAHGFAEASATFDGASILAAAAASDREGRTWPIEEPECPWWADRQETDDPIDWTVTAWLRPPPPYTSREAWDAVVPQIAAAARAERWDGDQIDGWLHEYQQAAADKSHFGFFAYHRGAYRLELSVSRPPRRPHGTSPRSGSGCPTGGSSSSNSTLATSSSRVGSS
jgi:hypothetical protein